MKTSVSYSAFDGIELLRYSLNQIRDQINYINVVYQTKSFFGNEIRPEYVEELKDLSSRGLIDELIHFKIENPSTDFGKSGINNAKRIEKKKRRIGLQDALKNGSTHWMAMDVDEFYIKSELEYALKYIKDNALGRTACMITDYHNLPIYRLKDLEEEGDFKVSFMSRVNEDTKLGDFSDFARTDPTRGVTSVCGRDYVFRKDEITMHHMRTVRKYLHDKFWNTSRRHLDRSTIDEKIKEIRSYHPEKNDKPKGEIVDNIFNIPLNMFNENKTH